MIILGIDPGTAKAGYGLIRTSAKKRKSRSRDLEALAYGVISTKQSSTPGQRLLLIHREIVKLINRYQPKLIAIESLYFFKNAKTAIAIAQARGVILMAGTKKKVPMLEITPLQLKAAITGHGQADKKQVQKMVQLLLSLKQIPKPDDAADALALAICAHFMARKRDLTAPLAKL